MKSEFKNKIKLTLQEDKIRYDRDEEKTIEPVDLKKDKEKSKRKEKSLLEMHRKKLDKKKKVRKIFHSNIKNFCQ